MLKSWLDQNLIASPSGWCRQKSNGSLADANYHSRRTSQHSAREGAWRHGSWASPQAPRCHRGSAWRYECHRYTTDNGSNQFSWPDAATTPFRSEKDTNWEGAFRVPGMVRWPGHIQPGSVSTDMFSGLTGSPRYLRQPAIRQSKIACSVAPISAARHLRCISMATTSLITSQARSRPIPHRFCLFRRRRRSGRLPSR